MSKQQDEPERLIAIETEKQLLPSLIESGYQFHSESTLPNVYLFSLPPSHTLTKRIDKDDRIKWFEYQIPYRHLYKRGGTRSEVRERLHINDPAFSTQWHLVSSLNLVE
jgi:hypothetical protein